MNYKFTTDGRKVAIVGALNAKETIVQEIFVQDGTEFPAGEHFVVKTLLDAPAETYKVVEARRVADSIKKLEGERAKLEKEVINFRFSAAAAFAKIKWIEGIKEQEVQDVFDNVKAMLCGEYTHVLFADYELDIVPWGQELFSSKNDYHRQKFDSLRLISLFGNWNGRLNLSWKVNTYRDGSGGHKSFIPCRSYKEAVQKAQEVLAAKDYISDSDVAFCEKHGIPVDETKNRARLAKKREYMEQQIAKSEEQLAKQKAELMSLFLS